MFFLLPLITVLFIKANNAVEFQLLNNEVRDIWVGIQGNSGHGHLSGGGLVLKPGQRVSVHSPSNWAGRFWPRTWCNPNSNHCETGDCGNKVKCNGAGGNPPASLAEITLKGADGLDFYDISLVDGFNIPIAMEPLGGQGDNGQYSCKKSACQVRITDQCPQALQVRNGNGVIACNSACNALNTDQYCCRGVYDTPEACKLSDWPVNYPQFFKKLCPDAYSYVYDDDHKSTFTCKAPAYLITFGA